MFAEHVSRNTSLHSAVSQSARCTYHLFNAIFHVTHSRGRAPGSIPRPERETEICCERPSRSSNDVGEYVDLSIDTRHVTRRCTLYSTVLYSSAVLCSGLALRSTPPPADRKDRVLEALPNPKRCQSGLLNRPDYG
jgi:hypothetical protein